MSRPGLGLPLGDDISARLARIFFGAGKNRCLPPQSVFGVRFRGQAMPIRGLLGSLEDFSCPVTALVRTNNTGAAQCETIEECVGQQGLDDAGDEQMSLIYSML